MTLDKKSAVTKLKEPVIRRAAGPSQAISLALDEPVEQP